MSQVRWLMFVMILALAASTSGLGQKKGSKAADPAKGKEVFQRCAVCHNATTDEKKVGPSLKGLFARAKLISGKKLTEQNVLARINEGGGGMPAFKDVLSEEEKANLVAYLKTL
jgi:cytochrome c2